MTIPVKLAIEICIPKKSIMPTFGGEGIVDGLEAVAPEVGAL